MHKVCQSRIGDYAVLVQTIIDPLPTARSAETSRPRVVVVGGGLGGLAAAVDLAGAGLAVTLVERHPWLGGKARAVTVPDGRGGVVSVDAGPTVLTLRGVLDSLFRDAGATLDERLALRPAQVLARHAWTDGARLDLHADPARTRAEIVEVFGEAEARGFDRHLAACRAIYEEVRDDFIFAPRPTLLGLARTHGLGDLGRVARIDVHRTVWRAVGAHFQDPRLRQLFARYATYTGGSPFQTPATLNLVSHVEQLGVWTVAGGMAALVGALADLAGQRGVELRTSSPARALRVEGGRVRGVELEAGELLPADAVVANMDAGAIGKGLLGPQAQAAVGPVPVARRSLSALTFAMTATTAGFPLAYHNVFFGDDYQGEFQQIRQGRLPLDPTVYACAQDRVEGTHPPAAAERLFLIVNAPARGDQAPLPDVEVDRCTHATMARLSRCGLQLSDPQVVRTRPQDWEALFPGTGGAIYGPAPHGWLSSFERSGSRSRLPGLYLAGGSAHPGAGVPMVTISGRLAAQAVAQDLGLPWAPELAGPSTSPSRRGATPGGTSTSSPTTAGMA